MIENRVIPLSKQTKTNAKNPKKTNKGLKNRIVEPENKKSMEKIQIKTAVENGRLTRNRPLIEDTIKSFEGKNILITVEKAKNTRTNPQNRWYWGVAVEMIRLRLKELGTLLSKDATHNIIKLAVGKINPTIIYEEIILEDSGEVLTRMKSTTELTTTDFMAFKECIQQWATTTLDIYVPDPNEQVSISLNQ